MRHRVIRSWVWASLLPLGAATFGACSEDNSIVGGVCANGYTNCDGQCVLLSTDPRNCGGCGVVCSASSCVESRCAGSVDGGRDASDAARRDGARDAKTPDAPTDVRPRDVTVADAPFDHSEADRSVDAPVDGRPGDAPRGDARPGDGRAKDASGDARLEDGARRDGASDGGPRDATVEGGGCQPPFDTIDNCGACGAVCPAEQICSPVEGGAAYACVDLCDPPLSDCGGTCVNEQTDPDNCGACFVSCPSGLCIMGVCTGSSAGNLVVIGHDYAAATIRASEAALLSNAVFLPRANPLHVISFEEYAVAAQVSHAKSVLMQSATSEGRTIDFTVVTADATVPDDLVPSMYQVLLVYDQASAPAGSLATIGMSWQMPLASFLEAGGDVVVLDGASGASDQMPAFLTAAGLLETSADAPITVGTQLFVVAPLDAVAGAVITPYAAEADTVSFVTSEANGGDLVYVVEQGTGASAVPVVIHKSFP